MPDLTNLVRPLRSLPFTKASRERHTSAFSIDWTIESSPTIILGSDEGSLPSFLSGQLSLNIKEDSAKIEGFSAGLVIHTIQKRPFKNRCADCKDQSVTLHKWQFLTQPTTLRNGSHQFPFSTLIPDHLPASMDSALLSVSYEFQAEAHFKPKDTHASAPQTATFTRTLTVRRSLSVPNGPLSSTRKFPSAGININGQIDSIIRPGGVNKVSLTLDGLLNCPGNGQNHQLWRIWKGAWRLEENIKAVAKACERHSDAASAAGSTNLVRNKTRLLGEKGIYSGWKSKDAEGTAQMEFSFDISNSPQLTYSYDTKSLDGTEVTHLLVIELVFVKEHFPEGMPHLAIRTGVGRILRLNYRVALADDPNMGSGWVVESLPCYQDEWSSPPGYLDDEVLREEISS
ncbi:Endocytosis regulator [Neonectria magnoliae]|uniref:Endocytosis regulator n=1 Tax=Neonectria magnoliae TaxID=2732573 RepID=A0ABR1I171_9HYPO